MRSWMGHQEQLLYGTHSVARGEQGTLSASTVHRWLDGAGQRASVPGQLEGIETGLGTDGLWAKLKRARSCGWCCSGQRQWPIHPPGPAAERGARGWGAPCWNAQAAGLDLQKLRGICSDGANGLLSYRCASAGGTALLAHLAEHGRRSGAVSRKVQGVSKAAKSSTPTVRAPKLVKLIREVDARGQAAETAAAAGQAWAT